jgi:hypothetical protein
MALSPTSSRGGGGGGGSTVTVSDTAPTEAAVGDLWVRMQEGSESNSYQLYVCGSVGGGGEPGWIIGGAMGVGAGATVGDFTDGDSRLVGVLAGDAGDENFTGLRVDEFTETAQLVSTDADSNTNAQVIASATNAYVQWGSARFSADVTGWRLSGAGTVDPNVDGYLWIDPITRVLKVSDGP